MAKGTVLSFSPEMINSGPRSGFLVSTFASVHELRLAVAACNGGTRRPALRGRIKIFPLSSPTALTSETVRR